MKPEKTRFFRFRYKPEKSGFQVPVPVLYRNRNRKTGKKPVPLYGKLVLDILFFLSNIHQILIREFRIWCCLSCAFKRIWNGSASKTDSEAGGYGNKEDLLKWVHFLSVLGTFMFFIFINDLTDFFMKAIRRR